MPQSLVTDAEAAGVTLRNTKHNDEYFSRSDNLALAEGRNLNYNNMAKLDRAMALCILDLANRADAPRWNESAQTKGYIARWRALHR